MVIAQYALKTPEVTKFSIDNPIITLVYFSLFNSVPRLR